MTVIAMRPDDGSESAKSLAQSLRFTLRFIRGAMLKFQKRPRDEQAAALVSTAHVALIQACRMYDSADPYFQILANAAISLEAITERKSHF